MITFENKLLVTNDINLALVQYGDIVCKDFMKAFHISIQFKRSE